MKLTKTERKYISDEFFDFLGLLVLIGIVYFVFCSNVIKNEQAISRHCSDDPTTCSAPQKP